MSLLELKLRRPQVLSGQPTAQTFGCWFPHCHPRDPTGPEQSLFRPNPTRGLTHFLGHSLAHQPHTWSFWIWMKTTLWGAGPWHSKQPTNIPDDHLEVWGLYLPQGRNSYQQEEGDREMG